MSYVYLETTVGHVEGQKTNEAKFSEHVLLVNAKSGGCSGWVQRHACSSLLFVEFSDWLMTEA